MPKDDIAKDTLSSLRNSVAHRFPVQADAADLLPDPGIDFRPLKKSLVVGEAVAPKVLRRNYADHLRKLRHQLNGKPELLLLHAQAISYLRRDTPHTEKALRIFRRLWDEEQDFLLRELPMRWLISALQTFHDHPKNDGEAIVGAVGFMYANLIKVYEAERGSQARLDTSVKAPLAKYWPCTEFKSMGGFSPGEDILRNINVMAMVVSGRSPTAGRILELIVKRTSRNNTIFSRVDSLRTCEPFTQKLDFYSSFGGTIPNR